MFEGCSCIKPDAPFNQSDAHQATIGACSRNCTTRFILFLVILFIVIAAEGLSLTPATELLLKLIDKPLQPFALGLMRCFNILIAYIPTPIILSQLIDKTCILWNNQCIGDKGTCLEYHATNFHFTLFGMSAVVKVISSILLVVFSIYIHKAYVLKRRYRNHATLNHDITSVLSPKQKYRIDSIIASSESTSLSSDTASNRTLLHRKKKKKTNMNDNDDGKSEANCSVVLKQHVMHDEYVYELNRQTSENPFTNLEELDEEMRRKEEEQLEMEKFKNSKRSKKYVEKKVAASTTSEIAAEQSLSSKHEQQRNEIEESTLEDSKKNISFNLNDTFVDDSSKSEQNSSQPQTFRQNDNDAGNDDEDKNSTRETTKV